jgi:hypothetical protein
VRFAAVLLGAALVIASGLVSARPARANSAVQIFAIDNCLGDLSFVGLSWLGVDPAAVEISLDLSYLDNGFREGTFRNSGPLPATTGSVIWDNLPGGRTFFIRLNQSLDGQSVRSATYFFQTCNASGTVPTYAPPATTLAAFTAPLVDCRNQACLVDSTTAGTIVTVPSLDFCANHPVECLPRYYYEPRNGQIMVYPNVTPSIYSGVKFENGQFVPSTGTVCSDGLYIRVAASGTCARQSALAR